MADSDFLFALQSSRSRERSPYALRRAPTARPGIDDQAIARGEQSGREQQLLSAARALREATVDFEAARAEQQANPVTTTQGEATVRYEVTTEDVEVVTPATTAFQASTEFTSDTAKIAGNGSELELELPGNGPNISIAVGFQEASLQELATLVNEAPENGGRVLASVVATENGFRLELETSETGAGARLRVRTDDIRAPVGGLLLDPPITSAYALIDETAERERGEDEIVEIVSQTRVERIVEGGETISVESPAPSTSRLETEILAFAEAYNALVEGETAAPRAGLVGRLLGAEPTSSGFSTVAASDLILRRRIEDSRAAGAAAGSGLTLSASGQIEVDRDQLSAGFAADPDQVLDIVRGVIGSGGSGRSAGTDPVDLVLARIEQQAALSRRAT